MFGQKTWSEIKIYSLFFLNLDQNEIFTTLDPETGFPLLEDNSISVKK